MANGTARLEECHWPVAQIKEAADPFQARRTLYRRLAEMVRMSGGGSELAVMKSIAAQGCPKIARTAQATIDRLQRKPTAALHRPQELVDEPDDQAYSD